MSSDADRSVLAEVRRGRGAGSVNSKSFIHESSRLGVSSWVRVGTGGGAVAGAAERGRWPHLGQMLCSGSQSRLMPQRWQNLLRNGNCGAKDDRNDKTHIPNSHRLRTKVVRVMLAMERRFLVNFRWLLRSGRLALNRQKCTKDQTCIQSYLTPID